MEANKQHQRVKNAYHPSQTALNTHAQQPDKQKLHGKEEKTMVEEKFDKGNPITWEEVNLEGNFVKFEVGKRKKLLIHKWGLFEREAKKYQSEEMEMKVFFDAEVLNDDGNTAVKTLSSSSKPFIKAIKPFVEGADPAVPLHISVKKMGEGNQTSYDVELVE